MGRTQKGENEEAQDKGDEGWSKMSAPRWEDRLASDGEEGALAWLWWVGFYNCTWELEELHSHR